MAVTDTIKDILSVKIKPRQDGYSDQFLRIFMVKIMLIGALLVGLNWYSDKITCIIPKDLIDAGFVSSACWINGLYVYEEIRYHADEVGYYGIPRDINQDGIFEDSKTTCATTDSAHRKVEGCQPMEKTFFLQYQYMTFFLLAMALVFYAPYILFRKNNEDMHSLKGSITDGTKADGIVNTYFNERVNSKNRMRIRTLGDIIVKVLYVMVSVLAFMMTDSVLNGRFKSYGISWTDWSKLKNSLAYDYMGKRHYPKPGNALLPAFGFCEVHEAAQDIKHVITNKHKFVCEMSQHILYQYAFIIIWFAMVFSIVVSVVGLLALLLDYVMTATCFLKAGEHAKKMYGKLTLRECHYLEFIRKKNMPLYAEVIQKLKGDRYGGLKDDEVPMVEGIKA